MIRLIIRLFKSSRDVSDSWIREHDAYVSTRGVDGVCWKWPVAK